MPLADRNAITINDARVAIDGRTFSPDSLGYSFSTPQATTQAIGARIKSEDGDTRASFEIEHKITVEDIDLLYDLLGRETSFEITGRIPRGDGTYKDFVLPNCKFSERGKNLQVGSTVRFSGECEKMRVL